jgi:hypothetical protein
MSLIDVIFIFYPQIYASLGPLAHLYGSLKAGGLGNVGWGKRHYIATSAQWVFGSPILYIKVEFSSGVKWPGP